MSRVCRIDELLFKKGNWTTFRNSRFLEEFKRWIAGANDHWLKYEIVANVFRSFVEEYGDEPRGSTLFFGDTIVHLEQQLSVSISQIAKHFYRDHLNHSVRVCLLANSILSTCYNPGRRGTDIRLSLVGACLYHDIGNYLALFPRAVALVG